MADTAHSDPYAIFMRKIGYSSGLEYTLKRVSDLQEMYTTSKDVTAVSWNNLGLDHWGRKPDNITDAFYSLRLIQKTAGDLLVLENLDAMAIACAMLESTEECERARAFVFLWAVLVNDGELFLNMLLAEFDEARIKEVLPSMIEKKRSILIQALPGKESLKRIYRTVTIERQEKNKGSAGTAQSVASLNRTEPLQMARRTIPLSSESRLGSIKFSDDYFKKVPPRRKAWALSLGLWNDGQGLTQKGKDFTDALRQTGYIDEENFFIYWPMDYELVRAGFRPDLLGRAKGLWDCLIDFGNAYANVVVKPKADTDPDQAVTLIGEMMRVFRSLHARKLMLRRELPITVAYPAAVALAAATAKQVTDLPAALSVEQQGEQRRIAIRQSRNTGGALSLKS